MTTKKSKTVLFASLIAAMILPFSMIHESFAMESAGTPAHVIRSEKVCGDDLCLNPQKLCTDDDYNNMIPTGTRGYRGILLQVLDVHGDVLEKVVVDNQIQLTPRYIPDPNPSPSPDCITSFVWIIQIQDVKDGTTVYLGWSQAMTKEEGASFSLSWTPKQEGTYEAILFHWRGLDDPRSLAPPVSQTIYVENMSNYEK